MTQQIVEILTSPDYYFGVLSSFTVVILTSLLRSSRRRTQRWWRSVRRDAAAARDNELDIVVSRARSDGRALLSLVLDEMRARFRAHVWLLLSFFVFSVGGFLFFLFLEAESTLTVPVPVSLGLVLATMVAVVLFVVSISDEGSATHYSDLLARSLAEDEEGSGKASNDQPRGDWEQDPVPGEDGWSVSNPRDEANST